MEGCYEVIHTYPGPVVGGGAEGLDVFYVVVEFSVSFGCLSKVRRCLGWWVWWGRW